MYFLYARHIFERLKIKEPMKTLLYNYQFFDKKQFEKIFGNKKIKNQYGGGDKNTILTYKDNKFIFSRVDDDGYLYYTLYQEDNDDNQMCIMIMIEKDEKNCSIHSLSYDDKCFSGKSIEDNNKWSGSDLLKIAFMLINKIKIKYKLKSITLTDNSQKFCKNGKYIDFGLMLILISGDTWYGKYGFYPKDKNLRKTYENNKNIIKTTKLQDVPYFRNMLEITVKKYYKNNKEIQDQIIKTHDEHYEVNTRLKSFLSYLLEYFDITCEMFYDFYLVLSSKLGITRMYGVNFIKYI